MKSNQDLLIDKRKITTEGIKYAGSKLKILPYIVDVISGLEVTNVLDGFSGSTRVSQALAKLGFNTTSSDISVWSQTLATAYLMNKRQPKHYEEIINHLNNLMVAGCISIIA